MKPQDWLEALRKKLRPPLAVVLGSPREVIDMLAGLQDAPATCYQMDLYQAERLREELGQCGVSAGVQTAADLWDLSADFHTAVYSLPHGGERDLKIDMVEQAFHILRPHGLFVAVSPYAHDQLLPGLLKKIFGKVHVTSSKEGSLFWCRREKERPRRRHEVTFHARIGEALSSRFLSRPGVFSYRRLDDGARAVAETMHVEPGDRVLDVGCGCGSNGIFAARLSGLDSRVVFVDSNLRAVTLTEHNARVNDLSNFQAVACSGVDGFADRDFDVVLANPPYYAQGRIAQLFIERALSLLKRGGRLYLVTKQVEQVVPLLEEHFAEVEAVERRGYIVFTASRGSRK
jgi:16S rRNA (guanine1207-N2)-methyltransferase